MEIVYKYSKYLSTYYTDGTKETYLEQVKLFLEFLEEYKGRVNHIILYNLEQKDIYNYIAYISDYKKSTIKTKLSAIRNFLSFINADLSDLLFKDVKLFNTNIKMPRFLVSREIDLLLNYYTGEKRDIIFLLLNTGLRLNEITQISSINYDEKYLITKVKGNYSRKVYFGEEVKAVLKRVVPIKYSRRAIQHFISYAMKKLGIEGSTHTLRHTYATYMYKQTKDILLVKELLGHKSVVSTQIYTHIDNDVIRRAYESNPLASFKVGKRWE